jgi:hypothetical protein
MVIRQRDDLTQIAVLEDKVLVEHYVARESQTSLIGNVYLGRVQNVLPSMEARSSTSARAATPSCTPARSTGPRSATRTASRARSSRS